MDLNQEFHDWLAMNGEALTKKSYVRLVWDFASDVGASDGEARWLEEHVAEGLAGF